MNRVHPANRGYIDCCNERAGARQHPSLDRIMVPRVFQTVAVRARGMTLGFPARIDRRQRPKRVALGIFRAKMIVPTFSFET